MFSSKTYFQKRDCTIGTACTSSYANIFMVKYEQKYIYGLTKSKVHLSLRYIEDIFFICKGTEEELKNLFNEVNKKHPSIEFDQK